MARSLPQIHQIDTERHADQSLRHASLRMLVAACILVTAPFLVGCDVTSGVDKSDDGPTGTWDVRTGSIVFYGDTSSIELPSDTLQVGQPAPVTFSTFGRGGGCSLKEKTTIQQSAQSAVLVRKNSIYKPGAGEECPEILNVIPHGGDVTFQRAGEAEIIVEGVGQGKELNGLESVELKRTVQVVE